MGLSMRITDNIIAISEPQDCNECPVAQALRQTFEQYYPVINVTVYHEESEITIYDKETNLLHCFAFKNSSAIRNFIGTFDNEAEYDEVTNTTILEDFEEFEIQFNVENYEYRDSKTELHPVDGEKKWTVYHMTSGSEDRFTKLGTTQRNLNADEELEFEEDIYYSPTKQHLRGKSKDFIKVIECSKLSSDPRELLKYASHSYKNNEKSPRQTFLQNTFTQAQKYLLEYGKLPL